MAVVGGGVVIRLPKKRCTLPVLCNKVYLIVRRDELRASKVMAERTMNTSNIEILWKHQTKGLFGDNGVVEGATLVKNMGEPDEEEVKIKIDGFFLGIGHKPNSEIFADFVETDSVGYIKTVPGTSKTKVPGVFACGDVQGFNLSSGSNCSRIRAVWQLLIQSGICQKNTLNFY